MVSVQREQCDSYLSHTQDENFTVSDIRRVLAAAESVEERTCVSSAKEGRPVLAPYDLLSLTSVDAGGLTVELHDVLRPDGKEVRLRRISAGESVFVVPVTDDGHLVLVRQWRQAISQFTLEIPAGAIEAEETPRAAASRELVEETGFAARTFEPLACVRTAPGLLDTKAYVYLALGCEPVEDGRADEPSEAVLLELEQALSALGREISITETLVSIFLAQPRLLEIFSR